MAAPLPGTVERSVRLYQVLLRLYPERHRREYGHWMLQTFRDICHQAYKHEGRQGLVLVWLRALPDLGRSACFEHYDEMRRWMMNWRNERAGSNPGWTLGLLIAVFFIALGLVANIIIREISGSVVTGSAVMIALNLAAALVMEFFGRLKGAVFGATALMILLWLLPLLWVADGTAWMRENPINTGILVLLAGYLHQRFGKPWPIFAVALILGGAHILISFL